MQRPAARVRLHHHVFSARHPDAVFDAGQMTKYTLFTAGPPNFVTDCYAACEQLGARPERIWRESFTAKVTVD